MITVQATETGYYTHLRQAGAVFEIADEAAFSKKWMRRVEITERIVVVSKAKYDGTIWWNPGDRFTIPSMSAFDADWMREAKQPQKAKQD